MPENVISELTIKATVDTKSALLKLNALKERLGEIEKALRSIDNIDFGKKMTDNAQKAMDSVTKAIAAVKVPNTTIKGVEAIGVELSELEGKSAQVRSAMVSQANAQNTLAQSTEAYTAALNKQAQAQKALENARISRQQFELKNLDDDGNFDPYSLSAVSKLQYDKLINSEEIAKKGLENANIAVEKSTIAYTTAQNNASNATLKLTDAIEKQRKKQEQAAVSTKKASDAMAKFAAKSLILFTFMRRAGQAIGRLVDLSNEYVENLNLFNVAMGDAVDQANEFVETFSKALYLDPSEVMRFAGFFQQIATGFGIANQEAYKFSEFLTQFSYDLSSFLNIDIETAVQKVQSGFAGELEPLRRVGFALDEATLQQVAYSLGVNKTIRSMTQAEKSYLRVYAIARQGTNVFGDLAETIESPANQFRILMQQVRLAGRALGDAFSPIATTVLPSVIAALRVVTNVINGFAQQLGFTVNGARNSANAIDTVTTATNALADAQSGLLSFDKFESLNPSKNEKTGNIFAGLDIPQYDAIANATGAFEEKINKATASVEWLGSALEAVFNAFTALEPALQVVSDILNILLKVLNPLIKGISGVSKATNGWGVLIPILLVGLVKLSQKVFPNLVSKTRLYTSVLKTMAAEMDKANPKVTLFARGINTVARSSAVGYIGLSLFSSGLAGIMNWDNTQPLKNAANVLLLVAGAAFMAANAMATLGVASTFGTAALTISAGIATVVAAVLGAASASQSTAANISAFASGGYPDRGQMFIANEAGAELVGNIGGRTSVANNDMIVEAIENAAYRGYMRAINDTSGDGGARVTVGFDVDNNAMARALYPYVKNEKSRRGDKW